MTPIIATILLVAMTIVAAGVLYVSLQFVPPPSATQIYVNIQGGGAEPVYGDGPDCSISKVTGLQTCYDLPAANIVVQSTVPTYGITIASLTFRFTCNGTTYLEAPLAAMEWVPGQNVIVTTGGGTPQLGQCGSYTPPSAPWDRLAYFVQLNAGNPVINSGDQIVFFLHGFECNGVTSGTTPPCGDVDYHGAPTWCYTMVDSDCTITVFSPTTTVFSVNIYSWG